MVIMSGELIWVGLPRMFAALLFLDIFVGMISVAWLQRHGLGCGSIRAMMQRGYSSTCDVVLSGCTNWSNLI